MPSLTEDATRLRELAAQKKADEFLAKVEPYWFGKFSRTEVRAELSRLLFDNWRDGYLEGVRTYNEALRQMRGEE